MSLRTCAHKPLLLRLKHHSVEVGGQNGWILGQPTRNRGRAWRRRWAVKAGLRAGMSRQRGKKRQVWVGPGRGHLWRALCDRPAKGGGLTGIQAGPHLECHCKRNIACGLGGLGSCGPGNRPRLGSVTLRHDLTAAAAATITTATAAACLLAAAMVLLAPLL